MADRAIVLRDGANVGSLARDDLTHDNMVRLMVGRDLAPQVPSRGMSGQDECFRIEGLRTRRYPQQTVAFGVGRGEILGTAGLVGAGRSEVAQAIFGVERPLAGAMFLDGSAIEIADPAAAIRQGLFLVPEDRRTAGLVVDVPVRENVTLPALDRYAAHGLVSVSKERVGATAICNQLHVKASSIETKDREFERRQPAERRAGEVACPRSEGADGRRAITGTLARGECTEEGIMTLAVG